MHCLAFSVLASVIDSQICYPRNTNQTAESNTGKVSSSRWPFSVAAHWELLLTEGGRSECLERVIRVRELLLTKGGRSECLEGVIRVRELLLTEGGRSECLERVCLPREDVANAWNASAYRGRT